MLTFCFDLSAYCNDGEEIKAGSCSDCARGYYKNNTVDVFMNCTMCGTDYTTTGTKSTGRAACTVRESIFSSPLFTM